MIKQSLLAKFISFFYSKHEFKIVQFNFNKSNLSFFPADKDQLICSLLQTPDLPLIKEMFGDKKAEQFRNQMKHSTGYLIFDRYGVIGYAWVSHSTPQNNLLYLDHVEMENFAYLYEMYIMPEKRSQQAEYKLFNFMVRELYKQKIHCLILKVLKTNLLFYRIIKKMEGTELGYLTNKRYLWHKTTECKEKKEAISLHY